MLHPKAEAKSETIQGRGRSLRRFKHLSSLEVHLELGTGSEFAIFLNVSRINFHLNYILDEVDNEFACLLASASRSLIEIWGLKLMSYPHA